MSKRTIDEGQIWQCPASTTSDDSVFETISYASATPEESVFRNNLLMDLICSSMDRKSLLDCRLLNSRWTFFGAKALQKMVKIQFTGYFGNTSEEGVKPLKSYKAMQHLPELMKASPEFPCTSFSFEIRKANELLAVSFFNEVGPWIKKLHLTATLDFEDVEKLLFSQLPNLEHFTLKGMHSHSTSDRSRKAHGYGRRLMFAGIHKGLKDGRKVPRGHFLRGWMSQKVSIQEGKLHPSLAYKLKLKYFEVDCFYEFEFPSDILPVILNYSPNLTQVKFPSFLYHFLMAPNVNRLHLLQTLQVFVSNKNVALLDLMAAQKEGILSFVKELILVGSDHVARDDSEQDIIFHPELWPQVEKSISKILHDVSESCEKLTLPQLGFLKNVVIPTMRKVNYLKLRYVHVDSSQNVSTKHFPDNNGMNWSFAEVFPNIEVYTVYCLDKDSIPNEDVVDTLLSNVVDFEVGFIVYNFDDSQTW